MLASEAVQNLKKFQAAFATLAVLGWTNDLYPKEANVSNGDIYDLVVVGGGTSGGVLAARLALANYSVLLIEAGGNPDIESVLPGLVIYTKNSSMDWRYVSEKNDRTHSCHTNHHQELVIGKVLGGSSSINYMEYARGRPQNFERWHQITKDPSWKWKNMLKYFKQSEDMRDETILNSQYKKYHGTDGPIAVTRENSSVIDEYLKGFKESDEIVVVDNIGAGNPGYSPLQLTAADGVRSGVANGFIKPLKHNKKLHLTRYSMATKIIFENNKATGVRFVKNGTTIEVKAKYEVIVSAGTINTPALLMRSGVGPMLQLRKHNIKVVADLPVGKNLLAHVGVVLPFKTNRPAKPKPSNLQKFNLPIIMGYSSLNKSSGRSDYETYNFIIDDYIGLLDLCAPHIGLKNKICDNLHELTYNNETLVAVVTKLDIESQGEVTLRSKNHEDPPKVVLGYFSVDTDLTATVKYIRDYMNILKSPTFKKMGLEFVDPRSDCNEHNEDTDEYWRQYALCMNVGPARYAGTCAMGAVVDNKLKVLGMESLRVVDGSVMPSMIGGDLTATIVAIGEKAFDMIMEDLKNKN